MTREQQDRTKEEKTWVIMKSYKKVRKLEVDAIASGHNIEIGAG